MKRRSANPLEVAALCVGTLAAGAVGPLKTGLRRNRDAHVRMAIVGSGKAIAG
jgi:hypothetical protein